MESEPWTEKEETVASAMAQTMTTRRKSQVGPMTGGANEMTTHRKSASDTSMENPMANAMATIIMRDCKYWFERSNCGSTGCRETEMWITWCRKARTSSAQPLDKAMLQPRAAAKRWAYGSDEKQR